MNDSTTQTLRNIKVPLLRRDGKKLEFMIFDAEILSNMLEFGVKTTSQRYGSYCFKIYAIDPFLKCLFKKMRCNNLLMAIIRMEKGDDVIIM